LEVLIQRRKLYHLPSQTVPRVSYIRYLTVFVTTNNNCLLKIELRQNFGTLAAEAQGAFQLREAEGRMRGNSSRFPDIGNPNQ